jgi:hypothetical protein
LTAGTTPTPVSKRKKNQARRFLQNRDQPALMKWAQANRSCLRTLFSLTYDRDPLTAWRAIQSLGVLTGQVGKNQTERIRDFIRRLFWLMNDESGGLGWRAPEVIGEILRNQTSLAMEYGHLLPAYLTQEPFETGTLVALRRLADTRPELITEHKETIVQYTHHPDPQRRAQAILALSCSPDLSSSEAYVADTTAVEIYDFTAGLIVEIPICDVASLNVIANP